VFDHPNLIALTMVGDGEAETGPLGASWHSNTFLNPIRDGARAPNPAPQRSQDQQPHTPFPHQP